VNLEHAYITAVIATRYADYNARLMEIQITTVAVEKQYYIF
jgi:hypothetical protein